VARFIGLDVGTTSAKGVVVDEAGAVLGGAEEPYPLLTPRPGWTEQDPDTWWAASERVLAALDAARADGIGLSGQMHGLVALGDDDRPLRPAILWNDGRTQREVEALEARVSRARLIALTGNRALAGFTAPKLLWMAAHEPELYRRVRRVLLPKDYVRLRLCGEHATDVSDASGTLLFDVAHRRWSGELLEALGIDPALMPRALESPAVSGRTADGVPVAAGAGDQAAGAVGAGVTVPGGPASVVLGTSGVAFAARERHAPDPEGRLHAFCHAVPGLWHVMGVTLSAAGSLQWLRDRIAPGVDFATLDAEAARWRPGAEGLLFAPHLAGERTPWFDPAARAAFAGLSLRHDRGAMVRAVMEGVAFSLRDCLDLVAAGGEAPARVRVSGGGARSELWLELLAAVLGVPVETTAVETSAAYGAALLGAVAADAFPDVPAAVAACVRTTRTLEPDAALARRYAELRPAFQALYPALREVRAAAPDPDQGAP